MGNQVIKVFKPGGKPAAGKSFDELLKEKREEGEKKRALTGNMEKFIAERRNNKDVADQRDRMIFFGENGPPSEMPQAARR